VSKAGNPAIGMGKWSRNAAECCLLFTRGNPSPASHSVRQVRLAPRREHSRKPDEFREDIEALFGDVPRLEMFSRSDRPGWSHWGMEVEKFD
jgi:N6-adenosine-specific RNA methylase IME4